MTPQYEYVIENEEWLEDQGKFSRYAVVNDDNDDDLGSEWVCHDCCCVIDDPSEHECEE